MRKSSQRLAVVPPALRRPGRPDGDVPATFEISDEELAALRNDVILCRPARSLAWLRQRTALFGSTNPAHSNIPAMIAYLAQWADVGRTVAEVLAELAGRFRPEDRARLPIGSYLFLRFAEGVLQFVLGKPDAGDLDFVITAGSGGCAGDELLLLAHFWKAQMEGRKGALDRALPHVRQSAVIAVQLGYPRLSAKCRALEGLLMLDAGLTHAADCLRQAGTALMESEDWLWKGRIQDGCGRAALAEGRYQAALEHFNSAKDLFVQSEEPVADLAWACFNGARALRLIASRLANNIDAAAERRRRSLAVEGSDGSLSSSAARQRLEQLRSEAFSELAQAGTVFHSLREDRLLDAIGLERGSLWADCGDLQRASQHASESFQGGTRNQDAFLMAAARLLQSRIEKMHWEEGVGSDLPDHAQRAHEYAGEALALALQCNAMPAVKRRLLAAIYVCQGLLLLNEFFNNIEGARECCHSAGQLVNPAERDELWEQYQALVSRALHSGSTDAKLRKWSEGLPEGKTFQQITEEFAELVIPAVWTREGKNISRVVAKLSISPKKVRRILTRVGLKA